MTPWLNRWRTNRFVRNVVKLSSARSAAMAIALVTTPIISRLFDPQHYGIAASFFALSTIGGILLPLAYHRAVIFPKSDREAGHLFLLSIIVGGTTTLLLYGVIALTAATGVSPSSVASLGALIWLVPFGAWLTSINDTLINTSLRRQDFGALASADVAQQASTALIRIGWGVLLTTSVAGLIFGQMLGMAVAIFICLLRSARWLRENRSPLNWRRLRQVAAEYRDYPFFRLPANFSFVASRQLPVIALGLMFPPAIVGFYAMANRAANMPLQAASQAISNVLIGSTMGRRNRQQMLGKNMFRVFGVLVLIGLPVFSLMHLLGEELLAWFLGDRWRDAGRMAEILAPYLFMVWISSFSPTILEALRLNKLRLTINTGNLAVRTAVFVACGTLGLDVFETLWAFVAVSCAYQMLIILVSGRMVLLHDRQLQGGNLVGQSDSFRGGEKR